MLMANLSHKPAPGTNRKVISLRVIRGVAEIRHTNGCKSLWRLSALEICDKVVIIRGREYSTLSVKHLIEEHYSRG